MSSLSRSTRPEATFSARSRSGAGTLTRMPGASRTTVAPSAMVGVMKALAASFDQPSSRPWREPTMAAAAYTTDLGSKTPSMSRVERRVS